RDIVERALPELGRGDGPDRRSDDADRAPQAVHLLAAFRAAGEMTGDQRRARRVARHQSLEPARFARGVLEQLPYLVVVHRSLYRSIRSVTGTATAVRAPDGP